MAESKTPCPLCDTESKVISLHWSNSSSCEHPEIPAPLREVLAGIWTVRGTFSGSSPSTGRRNFRLLLNNKEPVNTLRDVYGVFGNDVKTRSKTTMDGDSVTQYELATITHPVLCAEYLAAVEPTPLFYKAMTTVAGIETSTYRMSVREEILERSRDVLEQVSTSIREKEPTGRVDWADNTYIVHIPLKKYKTWQETPWPDGWWNSEPYYAAD